MIDDIAGKPPFSHALRSLSLVIALLLFLTVSGGIAAAGPSRMLLHAKWQMVTSVAFSPDGHTLASGNWNGTAKLWNPANGRVRATLVGHPTSVTSVAFSPDGRILATGGVGNRDPRGSDSTTVILWDVATGKRRTTLVRDFDVESLDFSPDGRILATAGLDPRILLWDARTGVRRGILKREYDLNGFPCALFSPDGRILAACSESTPVMWDVATGKILPRVEILTASSTRTYALAFSPDGRTIAAGSTDGAVRLWDVSSGKLRGTWQSHTKPVHAVAFSPDGRILATGSEDETARLWSMATGKVRAVLPVGRLPASFYGRLNTVGSLTFSPDGRTLATGSEDGLVRLWGVPSP